MAFHMYRIVFTSRISNKVSIAIELRWGILYNGCSSKIRVFLWNSIRILELIDGDGNDFKYAIWVNKSANANFLS
jgi:hypothetical protein